MFERRLILRTMRPELRRQRAGDPSAVLDDVLAHLRDLFNTRQGSVPIRPDYGMLDINDLIHRFPDAIEMLRVHIRQQVSTFEPRLCEVAVRHVPLPEQPLALTFALSAMLVLPGRRQRVAVETQMEDSGVMRLLA